MLIVEILTSNLRFRSPKSSPPGFSKRAEQCFEVMTGPQSDKSSYEELNSRGPTDIPEG